jgi:hypothetical protein
LAVAATLASVATLARAEPAAAPQRFIPHQFVSSTIPANGDLNPYGVVFVPPTIATGGNLKPFDVLVSNINASSNLQGTGSTIVQIRPSAGAAADKSATVFYQAPGPVGLSLALGVLRAGIVVVGSLSTTDGTSATAAGGPLYFIDSKGNLISTYSTNLHGPWGLALLDEGTSASIFVSNVLNGTVSRLDVSIPNGEKVNVKSNVQIAAGYPWRGDPAALEVGPAGLAYDHATDVLYVASTADNEVYAVPHASKSGPSSSPGTKVFTNPHLQGPVALALAPDGNLLTTNSDVINPKPAQPSEIIEFTKTGQFVGEFNINQNQGATFGVAISRPPGALPTLAPTQSLAYVNDVSGNVTIVNPSTAP